MIGDAVLEIIRSGAPVGAAGLLTLLKSPGARKNWSDEGPLLQIAIDALEESLSIDFKKYNPHRLTTPKVTLCL
ncbi:acetyltransferase [Raoultella ornithinolytica]|nr:acetyltransferase [Raoultella ornithinolytica]